ncbi:PfkB family carbohydrate kinase [Streptomyces sp. DSM 41972]|uniref:PfkB family carbohydrate kinase n=1 Tax=Streptomyces althioticus subsp. attaecolombicae TaxID=3075534 RepID=A0ABU3I6M8_9ACTN|nr:PfkB family carbohydrate kinase [Streptomyces sp. DSM 41972]
MPPERPAGNPTGAGDACVAALAAGLADGAPWGDVLREAVALSCPAAGDVDAAVHERFRTTRDRGGPPCPSAPLTRSSAPPPAPASAWGRSTSCCSNTPRRSSRARRPRAVR